MFKKLIALGLALFSAACFAQSSPGFSYGQVPTPGQWNSYFSGKMNYVVPGASGSVLQSNGSGWYSGSIGGASFPNQSANTLFAGPCSGSAAAPGFRSLCGADLPLPTASSLGGVESITNLSNNWISYIDTSGVPHQSQPSFSNLSGSATAAQMPAFSGDISTSAGSTATTLATVNSNIGSFGSSTAIPNFTVNAKGLVTAAGTNAVIAPVSTLSGAGTGVNAALANATNASGGLVTFNGALGTPASGTATNLTGTATGLTSGLTNGIKSATTTVSVSGATAPTAGQVLTATSSSNATWQTPLTGLSVLNGYINGFTLSNDGTTPNSVLDIAVGLAADSTNVTMITGTAFTKSTAGTFVAGTGANGMGTGLTIAASTWYHVFAIMCSGSNDVFFDTSLTAAHGPACMTNYRYIGSFKTDSSSHILAFTQVGQMFYWSTPPNDVNTTVATSGTFSATISTPLGIVTMPIVAPRFGSSASSQETDFIVSGLTGKNDGAITFVGNVFAGTGQVTTTTNASSQISYTTANSGETLVISTIGYRNPKVAPNN
jgi:hypothetical protein